MYFGGGVDGLAVTVGLSFTSVSSSVGGISGSFGVFRPFNEDPSPSAVSDFDGGTESPSSSIGACVYGNVC